MKTLLALLLLIPSLVLSEVIVEEYDDWTVTTNIDDFTDEVFILVSTGDVKKYEDQIVFRVYEENRNKTIATFLSMGNHLKCDDYEDEDIIEGNLIFRVKKGPLTNIKVKTNEKKDKRMFVNYFTELEELFSQMFLGDELLVRLEYECEDETEKKDFKFSIKGFNSVLPYLTKQN